MKYIQGKRILITGACGTVGSALVHMLLQDDKYCPAEVIGLDNRESELFFMDQLYINDPRVSFSLGDVRDRDKLCRKMKDVDIVFHLAALKHVVLCERSPFEAVQTNIHGVQNIIYAAIENEVEKVIFTSSDKAVNPTNVMGTSKLMGERLITAANSTRRGARTVFASTRFGNVLGSAGSVIPIFHKQIAKGGAVTLTDPEMTRFIMSVQEATRLVIDSAIIARGGEVFITKMAVARIEDLAHVMIRELAPRYGHDAAEIEIISIGTKPGEKLYEELMSDEETRRAIELSEYFSVLPAFRGLYHDFSYDYDGIISERVVNPYISSREQSLAQEQLRDFLVKNDLFSLEDKNLGSPDKRYWPGDKEEK